MIRRYTLPTLTAAGSSGSATASQTSPKPLNGELIGIKVVQAASPASTTDITISQTDGDTSVTLLTLTDNTTASAWYYPLVAASSNAGAAITYDGTRPIYVRAALYGAVTAAIAQGDPNQTAVVSFVYRD